MIVKFYTCKIVYMEFQSQPTSAIMKTQKTWRIPGEMLFFDGGILLHCLDTPFDGCLMGNIFKDKDVTYRLSCGLNTLQTAFNTKKGKASRANLSYKDYCKLMKSGPIDSE